MFTFLEIAAFGVGLFLLGLLVGQRVQIRFCLRGKVRMEVEKE